MKLFAAKIIDLDDISDIKEHKKKLEREVAILSSLKHVFILTMEECFKATPFGIT